ncbi:hypothetical protein [Xenorhabdus japonica]|uniref:O-antigen ligase n=1 Tax=Xenorhabdus japonica TaxID=53341 RepID=A0A1I5E624_9GAMM|nr:hypothetical protein [Xenorhabdus japonica]SFO06989.1 hypothetical protein SAMN05421579_15516 [Xenorhabdus japonica]
MSIKFKTIYYAYASIMAIKLSFYFDGASRYISLRATIALSIFCFLFFIINKIKIQSRNLILAIIYISISFLFILVWSVSEEMIVTEQCKQLLEFIFPLLIIINVWTLTRNLSVEETIKGLFYFVYVSLVLISVDTLIRLLMPSYAFKGNEGEFAIELARDTYYIYKYGSIMYLDSNYVAMQILLVIGLLIINTHRYKKKLILFSILLLFLTFSRAAYIGLVAIFLLYVTRKVNKKSKTLVMGLYFTLILIPLIYFAVFHSEFNGLLVDQSLASKVTIFSSLKKITDIELVNLFFGSGFDIGGYIFSYKEGGYAHAFIPLVLGEIGLVGLISICIILFAVYVELKKDSPYILLPYVLCGFSLIYPYDSMYILIFFSMLIANKKCQKLECSNGK